MAEGVVSVARCGPAWVLPEVKVISPRVFMDERGGLAETYSVRAFAKEGMTFSFVQENVSFSRRRGTVRGLHYQLAPYEQAKLVRCPRGSIYDVAVDIRAGSPTFGLWTYAILSDAWAEILIPAGFAHGFCTLEDDTEVVYKISDFYMPKHEAGIAWDDPELAIAWPVDISTVILSDRDRRWPRLQAVPRERLIVAETR